MDRLCKSIASTGNAFYVLYRTARVPCSAPSLAGVKRGTRAAVGERMTIFIASFIILTIALIVLWFQDDI